MGKSIVTYYLPLYGLQDSTHDPRFSPHFQYDSMTTKNPLQCCICKNLFSYKTNLVLKTNIKMTER